jgi:hypothetical protein
MGKTSPTETSEVSVFDSFEACGYSKEERALFQEIEDSQHVSEVV